MARSGIRHIPRAEPAEAGPLSGTLLAFDFGTRRIGVAVGETGTRIAHPLAVIDAPANGARFAAVERLVDEWHPCGFVVGCPWHSDGAEHAIARLAERFARRLTGRFALPVVLVDETLSSAAAESQWRESGSRGRDTGVVDALAAAVILQAYLDAPGERPAPGIAAGGTP